MRFLGSEKITVQPKSQSLNAATGQFVLSNSGASFTVWGSVQPVSSKMLERLPEAARAAARWVVYCERTTNVIDMGGRPGEPPDELTTSKGTLIPIGSIDHSAHTTGIPHVAYICAEVGADE